MKSPRILPVIALASISLAPTLAAQSADDVAEVRRIALEVPRSVNYADYPAFVRLFADDAMVYFPFMSARADGIEEIESVSRPIFERARASMDEGPRFRFDASELEVRMLGDDGALVTWVMYRDTDTARRTAVLRKRDGEWKIVLVHADNWGNDG